MEILEYHNTSDQQHWLDKINKCEWIAGKYLYKLLSENAFFKTLGDNSRLLLLTDEKELVSFCTYSKVDEIPTEEFTPWAGFVYTYPEHRGKRRIGKLLEYVYKLAKADGFPCIYISTGETGLYEKYGCEFFRIMQDINGYDCRVYELNIENKDYIDIIGTKVSGKIDRPLGTSHPRHPDMIYPINYGYVEGVFAGDGAEQDIYLFGGDEPVQTYTGVVTAVYHRLNDNEDKWIVTPDGKCPSESGILSAIAFQEQYFMGELYL